jgi:hypothetical protein
VVVCSLWVDVSFFYGCVWCVCSHVVVEPCLVQSCAPGGGSTIVCAVCVLSLSTPAIVFWLTCVAMCGCAAPMCGLYGVCLGCQTACAYRYMVLSVVI